MHDVISEIERSTNLTSASERAYGEELKSKSIQNGQTGRSRRWHEMCQVHAVRGEFYVRGE